MSKHSRGAGFFIAFTLSSLSLAANGPITSERVAARGVMTSAIASGELGGLDGAFAFKPREFANRALAQLRAATTFNALLAPAGVTLPCAISGNLSARIVQTRPTVLKLDWSNCISSQYGSRLSRHGPIEVVWSGNSLSPSSVSSIRIGTVDRDLVDSDRPEVPQMYYDGTTMDRNQRLTGALPSLLEYGDAGYLMGRYLAEAKGYVRRVQRLPEFNSAGEPSAEFYEYESTTSTDGAVLTGSYTVDGLDNTMEWGLIAGKVSGRYVYPPRPLHPTMKVLEQWYRGTGIVARRHYDNTAGEYFHSIDGKIEADFSQFWKFGCSGPDTFVYHTRRPLGQAPTSWFVELYDTGELVINGNTTATFTATGSEPYVDLMGHATVKVQGIGTFAYDYPETILQGPIFEAARCAP